MNRFSFLVLSISLFGCVTASTPPPEPPARPLTAYELQSQQAQVMALDAQIARVDAQIESFRSQADSAHIRSAQFQMMEIPNGYALISNAEAEAASYEAQLKGLMAIKAHLESQRSVNVY